MKNILLTGDINIGKSTIVNSVIDNSFARVKGFRTLPAFLENSDRVFKMHPLNCNIKIPENAYICGKNVHGENFPVIETFENYGVQILDDCLLDKPDIILMDELGVFEENAKEFQERVFRCFECASPVVGVIKLKESLFLDKIRSRSDVNVVEININNRIARKKWLMELISKNFMGSQNVHAS